jgi:hypothetical protein
MSKYILEVAIPTYNRTLELKKCLNSIFVAMRLLSQKEKNYIGIVIHDNSTKDFKNRKKIINSFKKIFESCNVGYFKYRVTGFNIGSSNNFATLLIGSQSDYTWILPDDDVARFDSIKTILKVIKLYKPCFINGGWEKKSMINYSDKNVENNDNLPNNIIKVLNGKNKINTFLSKNTVQLQEYVYKTLNVKKFFLDEKNITLINNIDPAIYAIYSMISDGPSVLLSRSIGIFRDQDPNSEWRHLWLRYSLQDWPILCEKIYKLGWIDKKQLHSSIKIWQISILEYAHRPDILLGINRKYQLSFFKLLYYHKNTLLKALVISVPMIFYKIFKKLINFRIWRNLNIKMLN